MLAALRVLHVDTSHAPALGPSVKEMATHGLSATDEVAELITVYSRQEPANRPASRFDIHRVTATALPCKSWVAPAGLAPEETPVAVVCTVRAGHWALRASSPLMLYCVAGVASGAQVMRSPNKRSK
jgi:hypothetical protein